MEPAVESIPVSMEELEQILEGVRRGTLDEEGYRKLEAALHTLGRVAELLAGKEATLRQLRQLLLGRSTEKTRLVLPEASSEATGNEAASDPSAAGEPGGAPPASESRPGHGRHGAEAFRGAQRIEVAHPELQSGQACPACGQGKVYAQKEAKLLVRIVGQAPLSATVYALERLRCHLCGQLFTAPEPDGVGADKYEESAAAMIAQLKYGSGVPFYRLEQLECQLGIPLPAATQWEIVEEAAEVIKPARDELLRQAAQGEVLHNDDTSMRVLRLPRPPADPRTGVFTSGIVSTGAGHRIALFFTGAQHAGENLADVLKQRAAEAGPAIQMGDALSRNVPKLDCGVKLLLANCLAHGRRQFVEVAGSFPDQCRYVLERLGQVYGVDAEAREQGLTPEERLRFHQQHSGPVMEQLHGWLEAQLAEKKAEPNSGLGKAINYLLRHWRGLTALPHTADCHSAGSSSPFRHRH